MISALNEAVTGAMFQQMRLEVLSNNLANINTIGFKKDHIVFHTDSPEKEIDVDLKEALISGDLESSAACIPAKTFIDFSQGQVKFTENNLDVALGSEGFFCVETPDGTRYTRKGNFTLTEDGQLSTQEGFPVLGSGGPITITDPDFKVGENGSILDKGVMVDTLRIVSFEDEDLMKEGNGLFAKMNEDITEGEPENLRLMQGYIEQANVNPVKMMTDMIDTIRGFESYQKVIQYLSETSTSAINEVGETF